MNRKHIWQHLSDRADLPDEPIPGQTLVEIAGESRVLIENHHGVREYSKEKIGVNTRYGWIVVCGKALEVARMTRDQIIIKGIIDGVSLIRRRKS